MKVPTGSVSTLQTCLGGQLLPPHSLSLSTHLELQDAGCRGPQGLYSLVGGQERSVGTESIIKQVQKNQGDWSPKLDASNLPHNPPVALRQLVHTPWTRQSAA